MFKRYLILITTVFMTSACTTGKPYYSDSSGNRVLGCDVEFSGLPSVDKFAVEYALSFCAKNIVEKGHRLDEDQEYLLSLDLSIPTAPCGKSWDHQLAKEKYDAGQIFKKQYGYIVANIDLGLAAINDCSASSTVPPKAA